MATRSTIQTKYGPLCKTWGDPTPATTADVTVRVNGLPVTVSAVNPYTGIITLAVPIVLTAPGTDTIEVDYCWFPTPVVPLATLNTPGLVLNKWDGVGRGTSLLGSTSPNTGSGRGVAPTSRYTMGVALGPPRQRPQPKQIGHRFLAFERNYSAVLNSPTTLRLNQNPHSTASSYAKQSPTGVTVNYTGSQGTPDSKGYSLTGSTATSVSSTTGYSLTPLSQSTQAAVWSQTVDLSSFPASGQIVVRLSLTDAPLTNELDGVWTGVGFGFHNNRYLYLAGFLKINSLYHLGMLLDPERPYAIESWQVGPAASITITGTSTFESNYPFVDGDTFQILAPSTQAGTYSVAACGIAYGGSTVTINETFPADYTLESNRDVTGYVAVAATIPQTYRLVSNVRTGISELTIGGSLSGVGISLDAPTTLKGAAYTSLLLPTTKRGAVFFGSPCRQASVPSTWQFVKYAVQYDQTTYPFSGIVASTSTASLPELATGHPWFVSEDFGYSLLTAGNKLLIKNTVGSDTLDTRFGYGRIEPFLTDKMLTDMDCTVRIESTSGNQDTILSIENGSRLAKLGVLSYLDSMGTGDSFRRLVSLPVPVVLSGLNSPETDGWTPADTNSLTQTISENRVVLTQAVSTTGSYTRLFDVTSTLDHTTATGRIFEARILVSASSGLTTGSGPRFGGRFGTTGRDVQVCLTASPTRVKLLSAGAPVASYAFDWNDGLYHTYRILADDGSATVSLIIDDTVIGTEAYAGFTALGNNYMVNFGTGASNAAVSSTTYWASLSGFLLPPTATKRTFGVWVGPGRTINDWSVPRTDTSTSNNSNSAATIEEMDWQSDCQLRVRLDPGWGVTVFRPDLAPPPYYVGEGFITEYTQPSAGWINTEYSNLPDSPEVFGRVMFGGIETGSVSQQRWGSGSVKYRIYGKGQVSGTQQPHKMVLNYYNVITSGELNRDVTVETVELESLDSTRILIGPCHMYADRVYTVIVGSTVLASTSWTFDKSAQMITLNTPLSGDHVPVTVNFVSGRPVSNTYLSLQPLLQSIGLNLLNEGTPPVPWSQVGSAIRTVVFGSATEADPTGSADYINNSDYRQVLFTDDPALIYTSMERVAVDNGGSEGLISPLWDGPAANLAGLVEILLGGSFFSDVGDPLAIAGMPHQASRAIGGLRDSVGGWDQSSMVIASGGKRSGVTYGVLNQSVMYPSYPAIGWRVGAANRSLSWDMNNGLSLESLSAMDDNVPPTYGDDRVLDPYGPAGVMGHGACVYVLTDYSATTYSRLGPWAGEVPLGVRSLLAGGAVLDGTEFVLSGGASLGVGPVVTTVQIEAAN